LDNLLILFKIVIQENLNFILIFNYIKKLFLISNKQFE